MQPWQNTDLVSSLALSQYKLNIWAFGPDATKPVFQDFWQRETQTNLLSFR